MKLKNKKTGKIMKLSVKCENGGELKTFDLNTNTDKPITLAELNEEWEDVPEEPKDWWNIEWDGTVSYTNETIKEEIRLAKSIGNYFETEEEAEKAVEKLKAWKRLKDKGFKFNDFVRYAIYFNLDEKQIQNKSILKDLDLLFGGEE